MKVENLSCILIGLLVTLLLAFCIDLGFSTDLKGSGVIIDKQYQAENSSIGTGLAQNNSGGMGLVVTSSSEPEKYILIVKINNKIKSIDVEPEIYYKKIVNTNVNYVVAIGYFSGVKYTYQIEN